MFYEKRPFLSVGLPFLTAMILGTFLLADIRKSRYEREPTTEMSLTTKKRDIKSLEDELTVKIKFLKEFKVSFLGMG